jgi:hypothetical protein
MAAEPRVVESRPVVQRWLGAAALAFIASVNDQPEAKVVSLGLDLTLGAPLPLAAAPSSFPWLAGDALSLAALWSDGRNGPLDIRFARLDGKLAKTHETPLRAAPKDAVLGRMIKTSFGYLAAWEDTRSGQNEIHMALTDSTGTLVGSGLVEEPGTGDANWPNLAWNGSAAAIVYYQFRARAPQVFLSFVDAMGRRVANGSDAQVSRTPLGARARFPDVLWTGSEFAVAWIDERSGKPQLYFRRVTCR